MQSVNFRVPGLLASEWALMKASERSTGPGLKRLIDVSQANSTMNTTRSDRSPIWRHSFGNPSRAFSTDQSTGLENQQMKNSGRSRLIVSAKLLKYNFGTSPCAD